MPPTLNLYFLTLNICFIAQFLHNILYISYFDAQYKVKHKKTAYRKDDKRSIFSFTSPQKYRSVFLHSFYKLNLLFPDPIYFSVIISLTDAASPAIPCIFDGIIIFVDFPSAAFSKLSSDFIAIYASHGFASFICLIPSATAF